MAELVLRPMRPRFRSRGPRVWPYLVVGLLVLLGLGQWFGGVYVTPPGESTRGRTALVWRADGEPFFNSPAVPGFETGPAGHVLIEALPFWPYAYRQSRKVAARAEPVTVGGSVVAAPEPAAPEPDPSPHAAATPAASPAATPAPSPEARAAASPPSPALRAVEAPRGAAPRVVPSPAPRVAATPAARPDAARPESSPPAVRAERDRRLERIRRELERIRREADHSSSAGARPAGAGG